MNSPFVPEWGNFLLAEKGAHADAPRAVTTQAGIGDRLRATAFAELQAREAFLWAARVFEDAPDSLRTAWRGLALAEDKHLGWLLNRMTELGIELRERRVSDHLWYSLVACQSAKEFSIYMANAEDRGRRAGERFREAMKAVDPVTAELFGRIAEEEVEHIRLAHRYYPEGADAPQEVPHS